jgi:DNA-binding transcriptional regulator YiaG
MSVVKSKEKPLTLKTIRKELKLTQKQFGSIIGVARDTVAGWEMGRRKATFSIEQIKILNGLLKQIGKSFDDLPDDLTTN